MVRKYHLIKIATAQAPTRPGGLPNNLNGGRSFCSLVYNDLIGSSVTVTFPSPKSLPKVTNEDWYIGLTSAKVYNTWENITAALGNNIIKYQVNGGAWKTITLPDGNYDLVALNASIQAQIQVNGDGTPQVPGITLSPNPVNGTTVITLNSATWNVDLTNSGLAGLLGFDPQIIDGSAGLNQQGEFAANINGGVDSVEIHCDVADGADNNGNTTKMIYTWTLEGSPWSLQDIWPTHQVLLCPLVTSEFLNSITVSLKTNTGLAWNPQGTNWEVNLWVERR